MKKNEKIQHEQEYYYHIVPFSKASITSILTSGLLGNESGEIFLFENWGITWQGVTNSIADCIAANQIFVPRYAMFEINSAGILNELLPDNVAEITSKWQWIAKQEKIAPEHIQLFGVWKTKFEPFVKYQIVDEDEPASLE